MPIPVGSIVQVTFEYEHFSQRLMNVTHWRVEDGGTLSEPSEVQAIADWFGNTALAGRPANLLLGLIPSTCSIMRTRAQVISPARTAFRERAAGDAGLRDASKSANFDAVVTKRTDFSARWAQGNFYLPGIAGTDMDDGELLNTYKDDIETGLSWLKNTATLGVGQPTLIPVIFRRSDNTSTPITSIVVQDQVRVMTRRTVGRGV